MKILSRKKADINCLSKIETEEIKTQLKRQFREPILSAFDIYKSNVYYGIIKETETEHNQIIAWYKDLCDLKESALINIPSKIKKFYKII